MKTLGIWIDSGPNKKGGKGIIWDSFPYIERNN